GSAPANSAHWHWWARARRLSRTARLRVPVGFAVSRLKPKSKGHREIGVAGERPSRALSPHLRTCLAHKRTDPGCSALTRDWDRVAPLGRTPSLLPCGRIDPPARCLGSNALAPTPVRELRPAQSSGALPSSGPISPAACRAPRRHRHRLDPRG